MTRTWRDNLDLMKLVGLVLVDEVHCLGEERRGVCMYISVSACRCYHADSNWFEIFFVGACLEVVVTRMKVKHMVPALYFPL